MKIFKDYITSIGIFIVLVLICLIISSLVFAYTKIPDRFIDSAIYLSIVIASFVSSFILCKKVKRKGIINGIGINIICILILFCISSIVCGRININETLGLYTGLCVLSGIVGGTLGVNV